jgi:hypothetical protein
VPCQHGEPGPCLRCFSQHCRTKRGLG